MARDAFKWSVGVCNFCLDGELLASSSLCTVWSVYSSNCLLKSFNIRQQYSKCEGYEYFASRCPSIKYSSCGEFWHYDYQYSRRIPTSWHRRVHSWEYKFYNLDWIWHKPWFRAWQLDFYARTKHRKPNSHVQEEFKRSAWG